MDRHGWEGFMAARTLTRADLSDAVDREVGRSVGESGRLVGSVLEEISDALVAGDTIKVTSFGTIVIRQKGERIGRNPKTGEECPIPARRVLVCRASSALKNRINESLAR